MIKNIKNNLLWGRPEFPISKVAELLECDVEDLFFLAAKGDLTIYVRSDGWSATLIFQSGYAEDLWYDDPPRRYFCPLLQAGSFDYAKDCSEEEWRSLRDQCDMVFGGDLHFAKNGPHMAMYEQYHYGLKPVAKMVFESHRLLPDATYIILSYPEPATQLHMIPKERIDLQDALNDGKLFMMKADVLKMIAQQSEPSDQGDPDDAKPEGGVHRNTLLKLIAVMAKVGYRYDPLAKKNSAIADIRGDLEREEHSLDPESIRKALKEAFALPHKPPKS